MKRLSMPAGRKGVLNTAAMEPPSAVYRRATATVRIGMAIMMMVVCTTSVSTTPHMPPMVQ